MLNKIMNIITKKARPNLYRDSERMFEIVVH